MRKLLLGNILKTLINKFSNLARNPPFHFCHSLVNYAAAAAQANLLDCISSHV